MFGCDAPGCGAYGAFGFSPPGGGVEEGQRFCRVHAEAHDREQVEAGHIAPAQALFRENRSLRPAVRKRDAAVTENAERLL
ncbi:hypothetical protein CVT23_09215 [Minwuia thermotolerans]|uniref:Uncharacterized protein n=1 Tax=Minwuia thermotolerans TaxID=2056226 RepID=A0A2M9G2I6_9PROT|nr:hypothetical protein CVT23_09215 [Minwuia thermotolerans]